MNIYFDRIKQLQDLMADEGIDLYYVPMDDCHMSEYVAEHFRCIAWLSGFTGSAAQMLISKNEAYLFTDGRYFIQAERQLEGSGIILMKEGNPGVLGVYDLAAQLLKEGTTLGFDGNVVNASAAQAFKAAAKKNIKIKCGRDLAGEIWKDRPAQIFTDIWEYEEKYSGQSTALKISEIRKKVSEDLKNRDDDYLYIISSLDDIAWIFNIRADDVPCNPVAFAYAAITGKEAYLCVNGKIEAGFAQKLSSEGVTICPYDPSYICREADPETKVFLDKSRNGYNIFKYYDEKGTEPADIKDPSTFLKAVKNKTEIENTKKYYIEDSISIVKFMKWIKTLAEKTCEGEVITEEGKPVTELTVDEKLLQYRSQNPDFFEPSFTTIAAYGANAAMMHYGATAEDHACLKAKGMLLVDSGGQYKGATTDITRTFVLGPLTEEEKKSFTLTAVSMLRLMNTKFIKGCTGENVDIIARAPMWAEGLDYKCGTGHGVGCCLNVHEGPHRIRWRITDGRNAPLTEGMFVTDEPGVYKEGILGVRLENELLVKPYMQTADGEFLQFENMTFIPIDPDGIDRQYMNEEDIRLYETYQREVWDKLSPHLDEETKYWLKELLKI